MNGSSTVDPALERVDDFVGARDAASPADRLHEVRTRARRFRDRMLDAPAVTYFASFELVRVPYPVKYGLRDACPLPVPFLHIVNRLFVVRIDGPHGRRVVLVSPSDVDGNAETPFFKRLRQSFGPLEPVLAPRVAPRKGSVEGYLAEIGLAPADVDYLAYDHLHTQDVRKWIGTGGLFPRAKLLVTRKEWAIAMGPLPTQADWYCPNGCAGIDPARVVLLDGDVRIGGFAVIATPGHTEGNVSFVVHAPGGEGRREGLYVTSENGVSVDSYAPERSEIPGVRDFARKTGVEVILNGNTLENSNDQYISMIQEKEMAGPSTADESWPGVAPSSELAAFWAFPGISPTFRVGDLRLGSLDGAPRRA